MCLSYTVFAWRCFRENCGDEDDDGYNNNNNNNNNNINLTSSRF